jgi:transposase
LKRLRDSIRRKLPEKWENNSWVLHHDNVPAHTSLVVRQFLASKNMTGIPHPPYSPVLTPCDFFLFPKMKFRLKGYRLQKTLSRVVSLDDAIHDFLSDAEYYENVGTCEEYID